MSFMTRTASTTATFVRAVRSRQSLFHGFQQYSTSTEGLVPSCKKKYVPLNGTYPKGFLIAGTYVGVKPSNKTAPDLALLASETICSAAAVFTKNVFQAAPVVVSCQTLRERNNDGIRAVVVNSGCANAVTGMGGYEDAQKMGQAADRCFDTSMDESMGRSIVMSTGVIGQRLPIEKILNGIPAAYNALGSSHEHWLTAAKAICTTDTFPKLISRSFSLPSAPAVECRIAGITKGAGMIHPNMATLLGIIATDVAISPGMIQPLLTTAVNKSFNNISIDGDTSTNDTVTILANGAANGRVIDSQSSNDYKAFQSILTEFSIDLAKLVVRDGEGATKFITIRVVESCSEITARKVACTIAKSPLVKTAMYGNDANWGRILCATGYSQISEPGQPTNHVEILPEKTSVSFIPSDGSPELKLLVNGEPEPVDEIRASEILQHEDIEILVKLGNGKEQATYWTCDYSHEYITINGDYRT
ncbi:BgTH12-02362 [Blumeria graminis f. sp. triticale]|uniref:Arginine biosynthesis bifunctional protein ArgJ, mitochondrial n=3 Tax=Blumeria graminis TaxID=34373 RepID=A0A061HMP8_BLUGR|nr:Mitochondrial ornithine acetyltransferase [Blumeria graminis f. sp. tritici 96224]CAD6502121.1 BgTH12-02362 [Blumeria graminis f. sp. triticale]VDB86137.1 Bgt-207 [Blumeria graminis f. sp. tritici]